MAQRSDETLLQLPTPEDVLGPSTHAAEVQALLSEANSLLGFKDRLEEIKERLTELLQGSSGVRHGNQCFMLRFQSGKRTLKPALLIENGVTPEQIDASTVPGKDYWVCEMPVIGAPKKKSKKTNEED